MNTARIRYDTVQIIHKKIILKIDAHNLSSEKYKSHLVSTSFSQNPTLGIQDLFFQLRIFSIPYFHHDDT